MKNINLCHPPCRGDLGASYILCAMWLNDNKLFKMKLDDYNSEDPWSKLLNLSFYKQDFGIFISNIYI